MPTRLFDGSGDPVALGREIARGGEGAIFEVTHDDKLVAKLYHSAVEQEKIEKLQVMARAATPDLLQIAAWPTGTLYQKPGGELAGILMPRVSGHRELHELYSPSQRKQHFPKADWAFLVHVAMNCAAAFDTIHSHGQVIGDVNQSGVLVSERGTVHLIDCDSFQIRNSGRLFYCTVGVPLFTPPELQGVAFRGVERTANHDVFGLAVLIFQLLFMGRHPFAGRFSGPGEMPIERAISEGRFAFSRHCASFQMMPPPLALPIDALPGAIADLFEQAFMRPASCNTRPSASEWREAMSILRQNLKTCTIDRGHRFYANLRSCPWCDLVSSGGPNFFVAVQVILNPGQLELAKVDFAHLWEKIEQIPRPAFERPQMPSRPATLTPEPLPEEILDERLLLRVVRAMTFVAVIFLLAGFFTVVLVRWLGTGLLVLFSVWWFVLRRFSKLEAEIERRRKHVTSKRHRLDELRRSWDEKADGAVRRFNALFYELEQVKDRALGIRDDFHREKHRFEEERRDAQLEEFLDRQYLRHVKIPGIGPGRLATLLSYGIETAADIDESRLDRIPGFGASLISDLVAWRNEVARRFVFDPKRAAPSTQLQGSLIKYRQLQQICEAKLTSGAVELARIAMTARHDVQELEDEIQRLVPEIWQADADMQAL